MSKRQSNFRVLSINDPAIDTARMTQQQIRDYFETRDEAKIAPFLKSDARPMWFHVREIPRRLMKQVAAVELAAFRNERAFLAGVTAIENLPQGDGFMPGPFAPARDQNDMLPEEVLEQREIPFGITDEIGLLCWDHSFLAGRTARTYRVPLTSLETLSARAFLSAASSPSSPAPSNSGTSSAASEASGETGPRPPSSGAGSGSPTDADAAATPSQAVA
jgi:hypothetical protein